MRVRASVAAEYAALAGLPSYRTTLDRDGFRDGGDMVVTGTEADVLAGLRATPAPPPCSSASSATPGERARTLAFLGAL